MIRLAVLLISLILGSSHANTVIAYYRDVAPEAVQGVYRITSQEIPIDSNATIYTAGSCLQLAGSEIRWHPENDEASCEGAIIVATQTETTTVVVSLHAIPGVRTEDVRVTYFTSGRIPVDDQSHELSRAITYHLSNDGECPVEILGFGNDSAIEKLLGHKIRVYEGDMDPSYDRTLAWDTFPYLMNAGDSVTITVPIAFSDHQPGSDTQREVSFLPHLRFVETGGVETWLPLSGTRSLPSPSDD